MSDGPMVPADVVRAFSETARRLYVSEDLDETLGRITASAVETIPACDVASISLVEPSGAITTRAPTDALADRLDEVQYETGEGPCLDAIGTTALAYAPDTTGDDRWPRFSARAREEHGVASILSCRLDVRDETERTLGALNLYARHASAFTEADMRMMILFAANAAVVAHAALNQWNLRKALDSRDVIGQAKGILMARQNVSADEAFEMLRHASQRTNIKLRDLAEQIAARNGSGVDVTGPNVASPADA